MFCVSHFWGYWPSGEFYSGSLCKGTETKWLQSIHGCYSWSKSTQSSSQSCSCWAYSWVCCQFSIGCLAFPFFYVVIKFWSMLESDMFPVKESYHLYSSLLSSVFNSLKPKWWFLYLGGFPTNRNELKGHMFSILFSWQECGWGCWWTWSCLCWRVAILSGRGSN